MLKHAFSLILILTVMSGFVCCSYQKQSKTYMQWNRIKNPNSKRILVVPLSFPDTFFGDDIEKIKIRYTVKLPKYINELSYGKERIDVEVTPWMEMPNSISHYRLSSWRIKAWSSSDQKRRFILVKDAAELIEKNYDLDS